MGKFNKIVSSLLIFITINIAFIIATNFTNKKVYFLELPQNINLVTNKNNYIYSGYLLQYFIYKSSNINNNITIKNIEKNIINNKNKIFNIFINKNNLIIKNKKFFEMSLISSIVNISIYGMNNLKEFFAEAYSKWITTPNNMKNKSWEILNNFFIDIYPIFQKYNFGSHINNLKRKIDLIDNYAINSKTIYNTNLKNKPIDPVDLKYNNEFFNNDFGLQQLIPENDTEWDSSYTFNIFKKSLIMWQSIGKDNIENNKFYFNGNVIRNLIINNKKNNFTNELSNIMNDSYTKASEKSLIKYKNFVDASKIQYYSTFDKLDYDLKNLTKYENNYYNQKGSAIFLKNSVDAIQKYYGWEEKIINSFKNQILNLFNITYLITNNNFKYFLNGFLFSPDYPLMGQNKEIAAYTRLYFQDKTLSLKNNIFVKNVNIVISTKKINYYLLNKNIYEYQSEWWSSPNVFCTLNHEMGHAVDAYYNTTKEIRNILPNYLKNLLSESRIKEQYSGNIFGFDNYQNINYFQKINIIKIILIILFGSFCFGIIIFIIFGKDDKNKF